MEIRQLRYFVNAATTLSFTEAARLSNVAQSTLSQQVKQLEIELGMPLFHRMGKHIQLTAEGQMFLQDAHRILDDARQGLQRLADQRELKGGSVDIGLASGLGLSSLLTEVLTEYNRSYPQVQLRIHQTAAPMLPELLRQHSI
ncbi:MAG: LysR family transcriptional regulator, partial [Candidatus Cryptobacteroides sp.]|nr:LysR family transcriptional regulator [Candidatus Cryptobacteroides sp.]